MAIIKDVERNEKGKYISLNIEGETDLAIVSRTHKRR